MNVQQHFINALKEELVTLGIKADVQFDGNAWVKVRFDLLSDLNLYKLVGKCKDTSFPCRLIFLSFEHAGTAICDKTGIIDEYGPK